MFTYTYEILENGYTILRDGVPYLVQIEPFIPYPNLSYEDGAKKHIQEQTENDNRSNIPTESLEEKVTSIDLENKEQNQAIAEITMMITPSI